jgi:PTS system ascorbate-specific IIB component
MIVCGFGLGSSMVLRLKLDSVLRKHGLAARTFCADATTARGQDFDAVFTSEELLDTFEGVDQPIVVIDNFMSEAEVEEKGVPVVRSLVEEKEN